MNAWTRRWHIQSLPIAAIVGDRHYGDVHSADVFILLRNNLDATSENIEINLVLLRVVEIDFAYR